MSYLLHGSTAHIGMGWLNLVPRAGYFYIGGLYALYQTDLIKTAGIMYVLSVIDYDALLQENFPHLKHFHIHAEDHPNENLLQCFGGVVRWIDQALKRVDEDSMPAEGGKGRKAGVFVHCAMGKSRSATLVSA
jgi:dual specificity phosphatase 12